MSAAAAAADEFDCVDCGRPVFMLRAGASKFTGGRCATCFSLPGWFLVPELKRIWEPDDDWQPPQHKPVQDPDNPALWHCEVRGCPNRSALIRTSDYRVGFRGRCVDHLHPEVARYLHAQRNRGVSEK